MAMLIHSSSVDELGLNNFPFLCTTIRVTSHNRSSAYTLQAGSARVTYGTLVSAVGVVGGHVAVVDCKEVT